jgi:hypothetical protein
VDRIPEGAIRYGALSGALLCWTVYGSIAIACIIASLGVLSGLLPQPNPHGLNLAYMIMITLLILAVVEIVIYNAFLKKPLDRWKMEAYQELETYIDDPELLAELAETPRESPAYYELVIRNYQDFMVGLAYLSIVLLLPGIFLGLFLTIPIGVPFVVLEAFGIIPDGYSYIISYCLDQILAAPLWYKVGFFRIYRRGRIKSLKAGRGINIEAPRPGPYK